MGNETNSTNNQTNNNPARQNAQAVLNTLPSHSRGAKLVDFTKPTDEFPEGLSPAEQKLLQSCTRGEECIIGDGTRPSSATRKNKIRGSFLRYLILGGCENVPIHQAGIQVMGAFIQCRNNVLELDSVKIEQDIGLMNCKIDGSINLIGANCQTLSLKGSSLRALEADSLLATGDIFLRNKFEAFEKVSLPGAQIQGDLSCRNGNFFENITAQNVFVSGNVFFDKNFQVKGTVDFRNAEIGGNIICSDATFHNKDKAIQANKATIHGNVILGNCNSAGGFSFQGAEIGGDFSASGATISAKKSIEFRNANIAGTLHWRDITHAPGMLNLGGATVKTLNMDQASWHKPISIKLNNFTYQGFSDLEKGTSSNYWKRFLEQQPNTDLTSKFRPKPFEHLATILQSIGFDEEAKNIRIERQKRQTEFMEKHDPDRYSKGHNGNKQINIMHMLTVFWRKWVMGIFIDYGFRPGKAALFLVGLIAFGCLVYWNAAINGIMAPTHPLIFKEATNGGFIPEKCANNWVYFPVSIADKCADAVPSEYSEFQSFIYAADVALPIVNFRMEADWSPRVVNINGSRNWHGWWVRTFEWFSIFSG